MPQETIDRTQFRSGALFLHEGSTEKDPKKVIHQSTHRMGVGGTVHRIYTQDSPLVVIETKRPRIGGRNVFLCQPGIYVLAQEEGSFRSLACTQANAGFVEIFDWNGKAGKTEEKRPMLQMAPPILGQWPLDANFLNGLTVVIGGGHHSAMLTVVWFLASDIGGTNGSATNGGNGGAKNGVAKK